MRKLIVAGVAAAALCWVAAAAQQPPSPSAAGPSEEAGGKLAGLVVTADTGEPLRGVSVWVFSRGRRGGRTGRVLTSTGVDGKFLYEDLPPGEYGITLSKTGYETRARFREQARVRVPAGGAAREVVIRLRPSVVIEGRVIDAEGEPLPGVEVMALRRSYRPGTQPLSRAGEAVTNDLGEYRIFGLHVGRFLVRAGARQEGAGQGVSYFRYRPVFYPGALSEDGAVELKLSWGAERSGVDFELGPAPETSLTAVIFDAAGEPCQGCSVSVRAPNGPPDIHADTNGEGLSTFRGLPPGTYALWVERHGQEVDFARGQVWVSEGRGAAVQLQASRGQSVSGEVVLEDPPDGAERERPVRPMFVRLEPDFDRRRGVRPEPLRKGGGEFEVTRVPPGSYKIRIFGLPEGAYLKSVSLSGRPLAEPRITVTADAPVSGVKVRVGFDGATIQGTVWPPGEESLPEGRVTLIPDGAGSGYQLPLSRLFGEDGQFTITGVPPGGYKVFAAPRSADMDYWNPAVERALEPWVEKITLEAEEQASVEIDLIPESEAEF